MALIPKSLKVVNYVLFGKDSKLIVEFLSRVIEERKDTEVVVKKDGILLRYRKEF